MAGDNFGDGDGSGGLGGGLLEVEGGGAVDIDGVGGVVGVSGVDVGEAGGVSISRVIEGQGVYLFPRKSRK